MESRVVPSISETMALSSFSRTLSKVDLPTLGRPTMATGTPVFITLPSWKESFRLFTSSATSVTSFERAVLSANSTSSSLKSSSSSTREIKCSKRSRSSFIFFEKPPLICWIATSCAAFDSEAIKSATASAWDKSIFPFRKARWVYSPGFAGTAPLSISSSIIFCWTYTEPWQDISITSSPV